MRILIILIGMARMKRSMLSLLLLILSVPSANAESVQIEHLIDFDPAIHTISVNTEVEMRGSCYIDTANLNEAFEVLLTRFGFRTAPIDESQLEFAVSVKVLESLGSQPCHVMVLSMVKQVPENRMLRFSPGSKSKRFRLWTVETFFASAERDLQSLLHKQARKDVVEFSRNFTRTKKAIAAADVSGN